MKNLSLFLKKLLFFLLLSNSQIFSSEITNEDVSQIRIKPFPVEYREKIKMNYIHTEALKNEIKIYSEAINNNNEILKKCSDEKGKCKRKIQQELTKLEEKKRNYYYEPQREIRKICKEIKSSTNKNQRLKNQIKQALENNANFRLKIEDIKENLLKLLYSSQYEEARDKLISQQKCDLRKFSEKINYNKKNYRVRIPTRPYTIDYGLGTYFKYVQKYEKNQYFDLLKDLKNYSCTYLGNKDKNQKSLPSPNTLMVKISFFNDREPVLTDINLGLFISGRDTYFLKSATHPDTQIILDESHLKNLIQRPGSEKSIQINRSNNTLKQIFIKKHNDGIESSLYSILEKKEKEEELVQYLKDYYLRGPKHLFSIPYFSLKGRIKFFPVTLQNLLEGKTLLSHYGWVAQQVFSKFYTDDPTGGISPTVNMNSTQREICSNLEIANFICQILFNNPAINVNPLIGCFDRKFDLSFTDSEHAFFYFLDNPIFETNFIHYDKEIMRNAVQEEEFKNINKVRVDFISYKDMCPFCRGMMSLLLTPESKGQKSWFENKIKVFIERFLDESFDKKDATIDNNISIKLYCSSIAESKKH